MGGTWTAENKRLSGVYINTQSASVSSVAIPERGVCTFPIPMDWGSDKITELTSEELQNGSCISKIGYTASDNESLPYRLCLSNCRLALIYRADIGGTKANGVDGNLTVTAKYTGILGNTITIIVEATGVLNEFNVKTLFKGVERNVQKVKDVADLVDTIWVDFTGSGVLVANAGLVLTGGTNGTVTNSIPTSYLSDIAKHKTKYNVMAIPSKTITPQEVNTVKTFIQDQRENFGIKVQAVVYSLSSVDYEGIIITSQGFEMTTDTRKEIVTEGLFTIYVASITAKATGNQSNTYKIVDFATAIINPYEYSQIVDNIDKGYFIISTRSDNEIIVQKDINSFITFTKTKNSDYSLNNIIRILDTVCTDIVLKCENSYIGKIGNTEKGRDTLKADISAYISNLQSKDILQNFEPSKDLKVNEGATHGSIIVELYIHPIYAVEKIYVTITIN